MRAALRKGRVSVVIVAEDASENALARLGSEVRGIPRVRLGTREILGKAIGRGEVALAGITDRDLADRLIQDTKARMERRNNLGAGRDPRRQVP